MSQPWVAIQRNPRSGSGRRGQHLLALASALRRRGLRPRIFSKRDRLDARLQDPEHSNSLVGIVAAGGDGTIVDVINRHPNVPVCPFPLGTENLMAKYLSIPLDGDAVAQILCDGRTRQFDVGQAGDRRFLLMASAGFDAAVIHQLHDSRRGNISHFSYARPILSAVSGYPFGDVQVFVDHATEPLHGSLAVIANTPAYARGLPVVPHADPHDGLLDVMVFQLSGVLPLMRLAWDMWWRRHTRRKDVVFRQATHVRIESDRSIPLQIDGDPGGRSPLEISIIPAAAVLFTGAARTTAGRS